MSINELFLLLECLCDFIFVLVMRTIFPKGLPNLFGSLSDFLSSVFLKNKNKNININFLVLGYCQTGDY